MELSLDEKYIIFENLESLRGVNILNFNEAAFFRQMEFMDQQTKEMLMAGAT